MGVISLEITMSLDGFTAGPDVSIEKPMGEGGERLHDWIFDGKTKVDAEILDESLRATGAVVLGKRMYDVGVDLWGDTPFPLPSFVLTHKALEKRVMKNGTFTFVTDGIESALAQAKATAG